jgi:hypothetical protein
VRILFIAKAHIGNLDWHAINLQRRKNDGKAISARLGNEKPYPEHVARRLFLDTRIVDKASRANEILISSKL